MSLGLGPAGPGKPPRQASNAESPVLNPGTGLSGQESGKNQLDIHGVVAEVAPSHSRSLGHSPDTGHCLRGPTWVMLGTRDEMLGSEQSCPVGETGHKETMTREGSPH